MKKKIVEILNRLIMPQNSGERLGVTATADEIHALRYQVAREVWIEFYYNWEGGTFVDLVVDWGKFLSHNRRTNEK